MSQLVVVLQEPDPRKRRSPTTAILGLLRREKMDGLDQMRRKKTLKERLGLEGMGCCGGPIWGFRSTTISVRDDDEGDTEIHHQLPQQPPPRYSDPTSLSGPEQAYDTIDRVLDPGCGVAEAQPAGSAMNLAAALAAERQYRASHEPEGDANGTRTRPDRVAGLTDPGTPLRVSLMRLLEETDGVYGEEGTDGGDGGGVGSEAMCCVCMGRKKGAAFIPCGHTYCRVCSRELWLNRGSCPLCNRPILEILDIF
ncbi:uncharacterized protein LOC115757074 isoform X1 [Rhodamnia argentea]|uniref:Uncharacterized protein LOC115757074 isoform X1 n=2 Tax=Rhodamnia argentea TaxID=178133 RepID=A0A8B8R0P0_9MYRT|nr:uncharacterized protein LOC115757074 isoform X1 [Rhodamnia argentea]